MKLGKLRERLHEVELRKPERDEIDVGPRHEVAAAPGQAARQKAEPEAPRQRPGAGVDAADDEVAVACLEHHVLHAHEDAAPHVEDLIVEHRFDEGELVAADRGGLEVGGKTRQVQLIALDVDHGDLLPGGAMPLVVALDEEPDDRRGLGRAADDDIEQLPDLHTGGVDDVHVFKFGEGERALVVVHGNESHPFACGAIRRTRRGYRGRAPHVNVGGRRRASVGATLP